MKHTVEKIFETQEINLKMKKEEEEQRRKKWKKERRGGEGGGEYESKRRLRRLICKRDKESDSYPLVTGPCHISTIIFSHICLSLAPIGALCDSCI